MRVQRRHPHLIEPIDVATNPEITATEFPPADANTTNARRHRTTAPTRHRLDERSAARLVRDTPIKTQTTTQTVDANPHPFMAGLPPGRR